MSKRAQATSQQGLEQQQRQQRESHEAASPEAPHVTPATADKRDAQRFEWRRGQGLSVYVRAQLWRDQSCLVSFSGLFCFFSEFVRSKLS